MGFEENSRTHLLMITSVQPPSSVHLCFYNGYYPKRVIIFYETLYEENDNA